MLMTELKGDLAVKQSIALIKVNLIEISNN